MAEQHKIVPIRFRTDELEAVRQLQATLQEQNPWGRISFTDAVRYAVVSSASAIPGGCVASATTAPQIDPAMMGQSWPQIPQIRPKEPKKP
jgi:hypothetical protein